MVNRPTQELPWSELGKIMLEESVAEPDRPDRPDRPHRPDPKKHETQAKALLYVALPAAKGLGDAAVVAKFIADNTAYYLREVWPAVIRIKSTPIWKPFRLEEQDLHRAMLILTPESTSAAIDLPSGTGGDASDGLERRVAEHPFTNLDDLRGRGSDMKRANETSASFAKGSAIVDLVDNSRVARAKLLASRRR
jgi:hypothetical protein